MLSEIAIVIALLIFAAIAFFLIQTLNNLNKTLVSVRYLIFDVEGKVKKFDSSLKTLSDLGEICESEAAKIKKVYFERNCATTQPKNDLSGDYTPEAAEFLISVIKLGNKILRRR